MEILKRKIVPYKTLCLPYSWHRIILDYSQRAKCESRLKNSVGFGYLSYAIFLSIYSFDRAYFDHAYRQTNIDSWPKARQWIVLFDIGKALFDMGYRKEGVSYLEHALNISDSVRHPELSYVHLCCRLNTKQHWSKRLGIVLKYQKMFPEGKEIALFLLAKSYNDLRQFEDADNAIRLLVEIDPGFNIYRADYHFCKGEYQQAADLYDQYELPGSANYWQPQFDYKKAVAYYRTGQKKKWTEQAMRMGRRLAWDKFYTLDFLEDEGIERIPEIDQVIEKSRQKKRIIYIDKLTLCLQRLPWLVWKTYTLYPYEALFLVAGLVFVGMFIYAFMKYGLT